jgi:pimeloyl-ACP methyl ester carboxylesterase
MNPSLEIVLENRLNGKMENRTFENASLKIMGPISGPVVIAVHGYADDITAFSPLAATRFVEGCRLVCCDLPGFGSSPPQCQGNIQNLAAFLLRLADEMSALQPVGLMAHSVGAPIAVAAAHLRPDRVRALLSIEGNLTSKDAYFSGQAALYDDPNKFKASFLKQISAMTHENPALRRYFIAVQRANAESMWALGRDAANRGQNDHFGKAYCGLAPLGVETLYLWGRHNSPPETQTFVDDSHLNHVEFYQSGHWKSVDAPYETGAIAENFFCQTTD